MEFLPILGAIANVVSILAGLIKIKEYLSSDEKRKPGRRVSKSEKHISQPESAEGLSSLDGYNKAMVVLISAIVVFLFAVFLMVFLPEYQNLVWWLILPMLIGGELLANHYDDNCAKGEESIAIRYVIAALASFAGAVLALLIIAFVIIMALLALLAWDEKSNRAARTGDNTE